jgi:membrane protease YdiL (CAAX protease family)
MSITLRALLTDRPAYAPNTPWGPIGALSTVAVILLLCQLLLPLCLYDVSPDVYAKASGYVGPPPLPFPSILELLVQTATIGLVWIASGLRGGNRRAVLSLNPVDGGILTTLTIGGLIWLLTFPTSYLLKEILGHGFETIGPKPVIINDVWLKQYLLLINVVSMVVAHPFVEELLFRGFLLSAMVHPKIGFWGAALFTNTIWTSLHWSYPWHGLLMVFVLGVLFSFALWKTGSLWTCIFAHGFYNLEPALFQFIINRY